MSGTGSAGMELLRQSARAGRRVLIGVNGVFGRRMVDVAERCGAKVTRWKRRGARPRCAADSRPRWRKSDISWSAIVHAETSTGALQPLDEIARLVRDSGALLFVDAVTSLGGAPVRVDEWASTLLQRHAEMFGLPAGLVARDLQRARGRSRFGAQDESAELVSRCVDDRKYWGGERVYHHTAPISMNYALHEALRIVLEEGLEAAGSARAIHETFVARCASSSSSRRSPKVDPRADAQHRQNPRRRRRCRGAPALV